MNTDTFRLNISQGTYLRYQLRAYEMALPMDVIPIDGNRMPTEFTTAGNVHVFLTDVGLIGIGEIIPCPVGLSHDAPPNRLFLRFEIVVPIPIPLGLIIPYYFDTNTVYLCSGAVLNSKDVLFERALLNTVRWALPI